MIPNPLTNNLECFYPLSSKSEGARESEKMGNFCALNLFQPDDILLHCGMEKEPENFVELKVGKGWVNSQ